MNQPPYWYSSLGLEGDPTKMQIESNRKATFIPPPPTTGKRTTTSKSKPLPHGTSWPHTVSSHPFLTPSTLAKAGYYYSPDSPSSTSEVDADDQCCCFTCGKKLGGWDAQDDPFAEHWKRSAAAVAAAAGAGVSSEEGREGGGEQTCAWAIAVCSAVVHVKKWKEGAAAAGTETGKGTGKRGKQMYVAMDSPCQIILYRFCIAKHRNYRLFLVIATTTNNC